MQILIATWFLVGVGAVTAGFICWQAWESRKAAKAAAESGQAFKNAERAWILAAEIPPIKQFSPDPSKVQTVWVRVPIQNVGRTPGRVSRTHIRQQQVPADAALPAEPAYQESGKVDFLLPPGATGWLTVGIAASDFIGIWRKEKTLYLYGFLEYTDIGGQRETRFCYRYHVQHGFNPDPNGFYADMLAPRTYTRCT